MPADSAIRFQQPPERQKLARRLDNHADNIAQAEMPPTPVIRLPEIKVVLSQSEGV